MKSFKSNDNAVSPVIGVILMVAMTVILAAIVAAFVFGMAGSVQKTKIVAVTAQQPNGEQIIVTYHGGSNSDSLTSLNVTVTASDASAAGEITYSPDADGVMTPVVGNSLTATCENPGGFSGNDHVVVVGAFEDGTSQILLDTFI